MIGLSLFIGRSFAVQAVTVGRDLIHAYLLVMVNIYTFKPV
jgi:hypothetical protein